MREVLITSSALILLLAVFRVFFRYRVSARARYALWALVLIRLMLPFPLFESPASVMNAIPERFSAPSAVTAPPAVTLPQGTAIPAPDAAPVTGSVPESPNPSVKPKSDISAADILTAAWLMGAVIAGSAVLVSNLSFGARLRRARHKLEVDFPVPVFTVDSLPSPCLFGLLRPSVYITPNAAADETVLTHVLAHERAHLRHGDHAWAFLRTVCLCIYWFDPFVWLAAVLSKRDAELACDETAVKLLGEGERTAYGMTLISLISGSRRPGDILSCATTMSGGKSSIKERITSIASKPKRAAASVLAVLLVACTAVGCTMTGAQQDDTPAPPAGGGSSVVQQQGGTESSPLAAGEKPLAQVLELISGNDIVHLDHALSVSNDELAALLRTCTDKPAAAEESVLSFWILEVYLSDGKDEVWTTENAVTLLAGLTEDTVTLRWRSESITVSYPELYNVVRHCQDTEIYVDTEALAPVQAAVNARIEENLEYYREQANVLGESTEFLGWEVMTFSKYGDFTVEPYGGVTVYNFDYALLPEDPMSVPWAGGMWLDGDLRMRGFDPCTYLAVLETENGPEAIGFLPWDAWFFGETPEEQASNAEQAILKLLKDHFREYSIEGPVYGTRVHPIYNQTYNPYADLAWTAVHADIDMYETYYEYRNGDKSVTIEKAALTFLGDEEFISVTYDYNGVEKRGTAGIFKLEYRLTPDDLSLLVLAGGMETEKGLITERSSGGGKYMVTFETDDGTLSLVGFTNDDTVAELGSKTSAMLHTLRSNGYYVETVVLT